MTQSASVLDVGNCDPDHAMIRHLLIHHFDVKIDRVMFVSDAIEHMRKNQYALVLFNRLVFDDGSEGIALLKQAKADPDLKNVPIMMISNFPEAQAASMAAGGEPGFGKASLARSQTVDLLSKYLPPKRA
jgi:hypothetical protein